MIPMRSWGGGADADAEDEDRGEQVQLLRVGRRPILTLLIIVRPQAVTKCVAVVVEKGSGSTGSASAFTPIHTLNLSLSFFHNFTRNRYGCYCFTFQSWLCSSIKILWLEGIQSTFIFPQAYLSLHPIRDRSCISLQGYSRQVIFHYVPPSLACLCVF